MQKKLRDQFDKIGEAELALLGDIVTPEGFAILSRLEPHDLIPKEELAEATGIEKNRLNELLLEFTEHRIIEFAVRGNHSKSGYKLCGHFGIVAELVLAAAYVLSQTSNYAVSEYTSYNN